MELDNINLNFNEDSLTLLNIALALVMYGVALGIKPEEFKILIDHPKSIVIGLVAQLVLLPLATFLLVYLLKPQPSIALGMMLVAACPGGNVSNFFTQMAKGNIALSIVMTTITTFLAVFSTPLNLTFYGSHYPPTAGLLKDIEINFWELTQLVGLLLIVPLILGLITRKLTPNVANKLAGRFKGGSIIFFIFLVGLALNNNWDVFTTHLHTVFGLVLLHNALALGIGFALGKWSKIGAASVRTLTIETGIQNSGLGLLLIFTFFEGLGGMAIITAFWGIWHLVTGLIIGWIWGNKPFKS